MLHKIGTRLQWRDNRRYKEWHDLGVDYNRLTVENYKRWIKNCEWRIDPGPEAAAAAD